MTALIFLISITVQAFTQSKTVRKNPFNQNPVLRGFAYVRFKNMATPIYQLCSNPISGETFQAISFDKDAFVMQWTVQPKGYVPFEHIHLNQDEIFHVKNGGLRIVMDGREYIANPGETITVPKGVAHIACNDKEQVLDCTVEYKPGT